MKSALITVLAILAVWFVNTNFLWAPVDQIKEALEEGDSETLSDFLASSVLVSIHDASPADTKEQAKAVLAVFFDRYPPISFIEKHHGTSRKNNHSFLIGELHTEGGTFRINMLLSGNLIVKLDIEPVEAFL